MQAAPRRWLRRAPQTRPDVARGPDVELGVLRRLPAPGRIKPVVWQLTVTRDAALIDAAQTVQRWQRTMTPSQHWRYILHIARALHCYPSWPAIEAAITERMEEYR